MTSEADEWYQKGLARADTAQWQAAIASFDQALALNPRHDGALAARGHALWLGLGNWPDALASYDDALLLNPDNAQAWCGKGITLDDLDLMQKALPCFDRAIAIKPDYFDAWFNKGLALITLERFEDSVQPLQHASDLDPQHVQATIHLGLALDGSGQHSEALAIFERAIKQAPKEPKGYYCKGLMLFKHFQNYLGAKDCFAQAERLGMPEAGQMVTRAQRAHDREESAAQASEE